MARKMAAKRLQARDVMLNVRVKAHERDLFIRCAAATERSMSSWVRLHLLAATRFQKKHARAAAKAIAALERERAERRRGY